MKLNGNFRKRVMKYAWNLRKSTGESWRICMIKAWQLVKLINAMKSRVVKFFYTKTDGSVRKAFGRCFSGSTSGRRFTKPSYGTIRYYDIDRGAFRCFKIENLICVAMD